MALYRYGETIKPRAFEVFDKGYRERSIKLPDERYGLIFIFRVFNRVSYALVMSSSRPVDLGDIVQNP